LEIQENISLKKFNSFGIDVNAKLLAAIQNAEQAKQVLTQYKDEELLILGGGSNVLFTKDFNGLVLHNCIRGIEVIDKNNEEVSIKFGAGEVWHNAVIHCIEMGYAGIENLSLIPGNCGAAPMQNIGAYGVEIKDVFSSLEALHIPSGEIHNFSNSDCGFGYRESIFKNKVKGEYLILNITLKLKKKPEFNISYGAISQQLEKMGAKDLSIKAVSDAVIQIRQSKLPDPKEIGNAGSFFKNPIISKELLEEIQRSYPDIVNYPVDEDKVKLAAGWLIDQAGWKGYRKADFGVHKNQALVLVNYGIAKGSEIYNLSEEILQSVQEKYGVDLEREVNVV